jgi:hypothetical protein
MDILQALQALQNTPIPNLLVIAGIVFVFLAFVGEVGAVIKLPKERQKWSAIIGILFLGLGTGLFLIPGFQSDSPLSVITTTHTPTSALVTPTNSRVPPTSTFTPRPPTNTPTSPPVLTRIPTPRVVLPACNCEETISSNEPVIVRLRWGAKTQELAEQGANFTVYTAKVDNTPLQIINDYRKPAVFIADSCENGDCWWVYWDYPLGTLPVGGHTIEANVTHTARVSDGWYTMEKGTSTTFQVKLNVVTP